MMEPDIFQKVDLATFVNYNAAMILTCCCSVFEKAPLDS